MPLDCAIVICRSSKGIEAPSHLKARNTYSVTFNSDTLVREIYLELNAMSHVTS